MESTIRNAFSLLTMLLVAIFTLFFVTIILIILLAIRANAVTLDCAFTNGACVANDTQAGLLRAANDSAPGYANAHAQLMNYSGTAYNYTLCCTTDANHTLDNGCSNANATVVLELAAETNGHVGVPAASAYSYEACLALSPGGLTCEYVNTTCSAGYSPLLSMASSEENGGLYNQTNAHVANYSAYTLNVCCKGGNAPPTVPVLSYPASGNTSVFERNVAFDWSDSTDPDGDAIHYEFELNQSVCADYSNTTLSASTYMPSSELCVDRSYNWTVRACDATLCSDWVTRWNFTILSQVGISFTTDNTDFGTLARNATDNTTDGSPAPFTVENTGNVPLNVTLKADDALFDSSGLGNSSFQYKARQSEAGAYVAAQTSWTNVGASLSALFTSLGYAAAADSAYVDVLVAAPYEEPAGYKSSVVNITGEYSG